MGQVCVIHGMVVIIARQLLVVSEMLLEDSRTQCIRTDDRHAFPIRHGMVRIPQTRIREGGVQFGNPMEVRKLVRGRVIQNAVKEGHFGCTIRPKFFQCGLDFREAGCSG